MGARRLPALTGRITPYMVAVSNPYRGFNRSKKSVTGILGEVSFE